MKKNKLEIRAITKIKDGYKIYFYGCKCLIISTKDGDEGTSQFVNYFGINDSHFEDAANENRKKFRNEKLINFFDLPAIVEAHIEAVLDEEGENN